jgi:aquaporin NIP
MPVPTDRLRVLAAEFVAAFGLVFAATGVIVVDAVSGGAITHVGIGLATGLVVMAMIYAVGHISGAHFNPAVTLGFAIGRHFPWSLVPQYWAAQLLGGVAASLVLRSLFGDVANLGTTLPSGSATQSLVLEILLTLFLMVVVTAVATDTRAVGQAAAIAIGGTIILEVLWAGPISGASMNPVRSLAPAAVSGIWTDQWIYVVGPMAGAALGVLVYGFIRGEPAGADGDR